MKKKNNRNGNSRKENSRKENTRNENTRNENTRRTRERLQRIWEILQDVLTVLLLVLSVSMLIFTVVSVNTFDRNDRSLFGYQAFIVRSDSMSATDFDAGDLILTRKVDPTSLQAGDIIAFQSQDPNSYGETFTHKIRSKEVDGDGKLFFITYGTTTGVDDEYPALAESILGKYQFALPELGTFFAFLKTAPGYLTCIFLPFLLLLAIQGVKSVALFRQYRADEMEVLEKKHQQEREELKEERRKEMQVLSLEWQKLAAEREQTVKMMDELRQTKEQMHRIMEEM